MRQEEELEEVESCGVRKEDSEPWLCRVHGKPSGLNQ